MDEDDGVLCRQAAAYAMYAGGQPIMAERLWPTEEGFKPGDRRTALERALDLISDELDRVYREGDINP